MELTTSPDLFITASDGVVSPAFENLDRIGGGRVAVSYAVQHPTGTFHVTAARVAELRAEGRVSTEAPAEAPAPLALVTEAPAARPAVHATFRVARVSRRTRRTVFSLPA